jgi:hypothetical protein
VEWRPTLRMKLRKMKTPARKDVEFEKNQLHEVKSREKRSAVSDSSESGGEYAHEVQDHRRREHCHELLEASAPSVLPHLEKDENALFVPLRLRWSRPDPSAPLLDHRERLAHSRRAPWRGKRDRKGRCEQGGGRWCRGMRGPCRRAEGVSVGRASSPKLSWTGKGSCAS